MAPLLSNLVGGRWVPSTGCFFGDLEVHGRDAFEFYTDKKVTISRWF